MHHLNLIFSTAQRLQASRSFLRDLRGLDKTAEGIEFAKAIGEAAALGATPEDVVEQVVKAMAGNEAMALEVLGVVQEIAKAHVEQHTHTLANGKTVDVKAYENARTAAMKQTTMAHGATFHALRTKTPEAHENAAAAHEAAAKMHGEAHEVHPMDVPEVGKEHANLKGQHQLSADFHRQEAATMRHGHGYAVQAERAATASEGAKTALTTHQSQISHEKAALEHSKAHEFDPSKGHDQQAAMHTAHAQAAQVVSQSEGSPHTGADVRAAHSASTKALLATQAAHKAATSEAHAAATKAHEEAINKHMEIHGAKESDEDGHHGQIAKTHMAIHAYHSAKAKGEQVTKAEGPMTTLGGGTDLATKTGGAALAVEGRPDEKDRKDDEEEIGKAHVETHTRIDGGKVVQVQSYDTHLGAAIRASSEAHTATGKAQTPEQHTQTAALHMKASEAHKTAAAHAPEEWMKKGHEDSAKTHEHYAQAHHAKAKAADQRADTGVDTPQHTTQDIKEMENHPDYAGHGYLGHLKRTEDTDKHLAEAANKAGVSHHELAAHILSSSGRHMVDDHTNLGEKASSNERVAHMHRWITDPKNVKHYGIKEYAKDLEERAPKKPEGAKEPVTVRAAGTEKGHKIPEKPKE